MICTDNDVGGIDAADRLKDVLRENNYEKYFEDSSKNKDFNEDLKHLTALIFCLPFPINKRENIIVRLKIWSI